MPDLKDTRRLFVAIALPDEVKNYLKDIQDQLKKTGADAKWVAPANIHLTLKFIGETRIGTIPVICETIKKITPSLSAVPTALEQLGGFPSLLAPRILWIACNDEDRRFHNMAQNIQTALAAIGIPQEDRAFRAHLTLARIRSAKNRVALIEAATQLQKDLIPLNFLADRLTLYASHLKPQGPTYSVIEEIPLKR